MLIEAILPLASTLRPFGKLRVNKLRVNKLRVNKLRVNKLRVNKLRATLLLVPASRLKVPAFGHSPTAATYLNRPIAGVGLEGRK